MISETHRRKMLLPTLGVYFAFCCWQRSVGASTFLHDAVHYSTLQPGPRSPAFARIPSDPLSGARSQYRQRIWSHQRGRVHTPARSRTVTKATKPVWEVGEPAGDVSDDEPGLDFSLLSFSVIGTALIGVVALVAAQNLLLPRMGFGAGAELNLQALVAGALAVLPMVAVGELLRRLEDDVPEIAATSNVTKSLALRLFGSTRQPGLVLGLGFIIGIVAGLCEELAFRGVLQTSLSGTFGSAAGILISSVIFGALHAATPLYAVIAGIFSVFFGWMFDSTGNLVVPITAHAIYDWYGFTGTHYVVTELSRSERLALLQQSSQETDASTTKSLEED